MYDPPVATCPEWMADWLRGGGSRTISYPAVVTCALLTRQEVQNDWSKFVRRWPGAAPSACTVAAGIMKGRIILSVEITENCATRSPFMTAAAAALSHFHSIVTNAG